MSTLREVANMSGVSPATVSNVLHNRPTRVSPETRDRVLSAIRELNYRPGAVPSNGTAQTARTIGIFLWLGFFAPLTTNPYALTVLDGILTTTLDDNWNSTLISVKNWEDARAQVRLYADGRCDGFVIVAPTTRVAIPEALHERNYPFVMVGAGIGDKDVDSVNIDNFAAAVELTNYVIAQGHKRLVYLVGDEDMSDVSQRTFGIYHAVAAAGLPGNALRIIQPGTYDIPESSRQVHQLIGEIKAMPVDERPTAILCANDQIAYNTWSILAEHGLSVPDDISLTGFDDVHTPGLIMPPLTTVRIPLFDMGRRGAEILVRKLDDRLSGVRSTSQTSTKDVLPYDLVIRESVLRLGD